MLVMQLLKAFGPMLARWQAASITMAASGENQFSKILPEI
jgi:hypothetical protein